ncbi:MAG TPA: DUF4167 domain-containing protein [Novosphingobium sp.]|nr:DUF4167 domain-containing protein [Novosphingobium sp.]
MNNNRGNNRRRGRGGNRQQGGQQTNRIDSRARGNAPQLLEKYKKLAHDAHLNGDRVQEEYYLQFADHYFRVIADQRQRQEEARQPRRDDRSFDYDNDAGSDDDTEFEGARSYQDRSYQDRSYQDRAPREDRASRDDRAPRGNVEERGEAVEAADESASAGERSVYEPAENPFVRDNRGPRAGLKQRKPRRNREESDDPRGNAAASANEPAPALNEDTQAPSGNFDPAALPPAISAKAEDKPKRRARAKKAEDETAEGAEEKPKRRRTRKASPSDDGMGGETLETVE